MLDKFYWGEAVSRLALGGSPNHIDHHFTFYQFLLKSSSSSILLDSQVQYCNLLQPQLSQLDLWLWVCGFWLILV